MALSEVLANDRVLDCIKIWTSATQCKTTVTDEFGTREVTDGRMADLMEETYDQQECVALIWDPVNVERYIRDARLITSRSQKQDMKGTAHVKIWGIMEGAALNGAV